MRATDQGDWGAAELAYRDALHVNPNHRPSLTNLAYVLLKQKRTRDSLPYLYRVTELAPDSDLAHRNLGIALFALGRLDEAEPHLRTACQRHPDSFANCHALGLWLLAANQNAEAESIFRQALAIGDNPVSVGFNLAKALINQGKRTEARDALFAAARRTSDARELQELVNLQRSLDEHDEETVRNLLQASPLAAADEPLTGILYAAAEGRAVERDDSERAVRDEFDRFAPAFDETLLIDLDYRGPQVLAAALTECLGAPSQQFEVLDAGCGTGLCAPAVLPYARRLTGVDLSPRMLERCRDRAVYDELFEGDVVRWCRETERRFDLVVAGDVACYMGDLRAFAAALAGVLRPGGMVAWTTETLDDASERVPFRLRVSGRYQHAPDYVEQVAVAAGLSVRILRSEVIRKESGKPVPGAIVVAQMPAGGGKSGSSAAAPRMSLVTDCRPRRAEDRGKNERPENVADTTAGDDSLDARGLFERAAQAAAVGQLARAVELFGRAAALAPRVAVIPFNRGNALLELGRHEEARTEYRRSLELSPDADTWSNLGLTWSRSGNLAEAAACFRQAVQLRPTAWGARGNLARAAQSLGNYEEALEQWRALADNLSDQPGPHVACGRLLLELGRIDEALDALDRALALAPHDVGALLAKAWAACERGEASAATHTALHALQCGPENAAVYELLGVTNRLRGAISESQFCFLKTLELAPNGRFHSGFMETRLYDPQSSGEDLRAVGEAWNDRFAPHAVIGDSQQPHSPQHEPSDGRLRVGFLFADPDREAAASVLRSVLQCLDRTAFESFCYSNLADAKRRTGGVCEHSENWRELAHLDDVAAAQRISDDRLDVLIDLIGHGRGNRMAMIARKPARTIASWLGFPGTTGVTAVDYMVADAVVVPAAEESHFSERICRLPDSYMALAELAELCEQSPGDRTPDAAEPVTFGCLHELDRCSGAVIKTWAEILLHCPGSRLLWRSRLFRETETSRKVVEKFAENFVPSERLVLEDRLDECGPDALPALVRTCRRLDVVLDPFPYGGGRETLVALSTGIPVVTLRGKRFAGHITESYLSSLGLESWVAADLSEYRAKAIAWARDGNFRHGLREELPARMRRSPLIDPIRLTRSLEAALRHMTGWSS